MHKIIVTQKIQLRWSLKKTKTTELQKLARINEGKRILLYGSMVLSCLLGGRYFVRYLVNLEFDSKQLLFIIFMFCYGFSVKKTQFEANQKGFVHKLFKRVHILCLKVSLAGPVIKGIPNLCWFIRTNWWYKWVSFWPELYQLLCLEQCNLFKIWSAAKVCGIFLTKFVLRIKILLYMQNYTHHSHKLAHSRW